MFLCSGEARSMSETGDPMERSRLGFVLLMLGVASLCVWVSFLI